MKLYALPHEDGTVSIMQLIADHPVEHEIARSVFSSPVILKDVAEVTKEQAAAIRAMRPKPEPIPADVSAVPTVNIAAIVQQENEALKAELEHLRRDFQNFPKMLAEMISRAKAEGET